LRRERVVFEQVYVKLEKDLGVKRKDLARMIETVDKINDDRDQAVAQIMAF
jgi:coiled-coil domain-containing protein 63/114